MSPPLTPWSRFLPDKLTVGQLVNKFPALYEMQRFIITFIEPCHRSLFWARWIQSTQVDATTLRSILILTSKLLLGRPSCLSYLGFPTKILYTFRLPMRATCHAHHFPLLGPCQRIRPRPSVTLWFHFTVKSCQLPTRPRGWRTASSWLSATKFWTYL
jgi:hypothetical protein